MKCSHPGKPSTTTLLPQKTPTSPNAFGTTNTTPCTYLMNQTPGGTSFTTPASPSGEETYSPVATMIPELQQEASEKNMNPNSTSQNNTSNNSLEDLQRSRKESAQEKATTTECYDYYNDYYNGNTEPFQTHSLIPAPPPTASPEIQLNDAQQNNNNNKDKKIKKTNKTKKEKKEKKEKKKRKEKTNQNIVAETLLPHVDAIHLNVEGVSDCPTLPTATPRAIDSSATTINKTNFRVYSHNVNRIRDKSKLEFIPRMMQQQNIDAYIIQETHLPGDFEKRLINDHYIIHHGPEKQSNDGAKGGVAIILSPQMALQWKTTNIKENKKIVGGISFCNTTRLLSIIIKIETTNQQQDKKEKRKKYHYLCLTSIYFPHLGYKETELEVFNSQVTDFLANILAKKNTTHIVRDDINSSIGPKNSLEKRKRPGKSRDSL